MAQKKIKRRPKHRPAPGVEILEDGRYLIRVSPTHPITGRRIDREMTLPASTTLGEAVDARGEMLARLKAELLDMSPPPPEVPGVGAFLEQWLKARARVVRRKTAETYAGQLAHAIRWLDPELPLDQLKRVHLIALREGLEAAVLEKGYSAQTVAGWWRVAISAIADGLADYDLRDITARLKGPRVATTPRREQQTLSGAQIRSLVRASLEGGAQSDYGVLVALLAYTGMRRGEALALTWDAVNLATRIITVRTSLTPLRRGWQQSDPKSGQHRRVGIAQDLLEILSEHREGLIAQGVLPVGLVAGAAGGQRLQPTHLQRRLNAAATAAGLKIHVTPQVLRRTFNTLANGRIDRLVLQAMVGHADDAMTEHYLGLRDETLVAATERMWELGVGAGS